jgi:hypothetical protein
MWYNPLIAWLLRSPLHGLISNNIMLVTVTGHKSGRSISTPTNYFRDGNTLWVLSWRARTWWRNLRGGANARTLLAGIWLEGQGQVIEEENAVVRALQDYYRKVPKLAKYFNISLDEAGYPILTDCEQASQKMVVVQIDL